VLPGKYVEAQFLDRNIPVSRPEVVAALSDASIVLILLRAIVGSWPFKFVKELARPRQ
jgi:hypothetical protein